MTNTDSTTQSSDAMDLSQVILPASYGPEGTIDIRQAYVHWNDDMYGHITSVLVSTQVEEEGYRHRLPCYSVNSTGFGYRWRHLHVFGIEQRRSTSKRICESWGQS